MTEPITAQIILGAALAITLGLLVRALRVRRAPTPRSVIRAEGKRIVRICKQAARESSVLTPDVLERIELAGERDATGALREAGQSRLRAAVQDCMRTQLIKVLFEPSGLSGDDRTRALADMLDQLQPTSAAPPSPDGQGTERDPSRRLLEGAINRHIDTSDATQTLAAVLDILRNHTVDYSQLIEIEDEAEMTLELEST